MWVRSRVRGGQRAVVHLLGDLRLQRRLLERVRLAPRPLLLLLLLLGVLRHPLHRRRRLGHRSARHAPRLRRAAAAAAAAGLCAAAAAAQHNVGARRRRVAAAAAARGRERHQGARAAAKLDLAPLGLRRHQRRAKGAAAHLRVLADEGDRLRPGVHRPRRHLHLVSLVPAWSKHGETVSLASPSLQTDDGPTRRRRQLGPAARAFRRGPMIPWGPAMDRLRRRF